jgi:hypothetical protein
MVKRMVTSVEYFVVILSCLTRPLLFFNDWYCFKCYFYFIYSDDKNDRAPLTTPLYLIIVRAALVSIHQVPREGYEYKELVKAPCSRINCPHGPSGQSDTNGVIQPIIQDAGPIIGRCKMQQGVPDRVAGGPSS